ncbi:Ig-like domain-containing protein [Anaerocolumna xylanovorans]|uniref:Ig-like domain (Group 2) n=1 Tax=Anaerocolumna xylanovorans DSM 12503 TaxID=1121345 RepID=A0A1M7YDC8_9FIRM|nr:Ig-like domain-containing protein [Anaerocolumna xylanovorans]SHO50589.1 Ig-like domain (group 2) [Anaerocolumna xylanovorans DSM 12503]
MKKLIALLLTLVMILPIKVSASTVYEISSDNYALFPKETIVLEILKYNEPIKAKINWKSSNKKVAAVSNTGKVTAKTKGTATITGVYKNKTFTCKIKVTGSEQAVIMPNDTSSDTGSTYITLSKYNSLNDGISYADAVKIIGTEGTVSPASDVSDTKSAEYVWYGKDGISNAVIIFKDDKLYTKSQTNLE